MRVGVFGAGGVGGYFGDRLAQPGEDVILIARGIVLPPEVVAEALAFVDSLPPDGTASMQRDIMAGRPSELESQSGAVVRLGQEAGLPTPTHGFIYGSLLP